MIVDEGELWETIDIFFLATRRPTKALGAISHRSTS